MDLIKVAEEAFATGKQHPSFKSGDTVTVAYKIIEGWISRKSANALYNERDEPRQCSVVGRHRRDIPALRPRP